MHYLVSYRKDIKFKIIRFVIDIFIKSIKRNFLGSPKQQIVLSWKLKIEKFEKLIEKIYSVRYVFMKNVDTKLNSRKSRLSRGENMI